MSVAMKDTTMQSQPTVAPGPGSGSRTGRGRVAVVGGGLGSLAAACTLAARGFKVTLFERNPWVGGKAAQLHAHGFRFDMGPTILIMPSVLRRVFAEAGVDMDERLDMVQLDPQWRCFYEDGSVLDLVKDTAAMERELEKLAPGASEGWSDLMDLSERLHDISERYFLWRSVGGVRDTFSMGDSFKLSVLSDLAALRMGATVGGTVRRRLDDPRVAQMADHFTQYVGSAPDSSPAVLCGIAHMQTDEGIWYPMGGTRAVPVALATLARELGVELRTGDGVARILTEGDRAVGVMTDRGERHGCDFVVSGADAVRTHTELVAGDVGRRWAEKEHEPACSGVVLYLGLDRRYDHLLHHDFVFSRDPEEEFDYIYRKGKPAPDPTAYLCAPAATEAAVAPEGGEALYVLVHTPHLRPGHDWSKMLPAYREVILDKLERCAGLDGIRDHIVYESALTPQDIHDRYHVLDGAIYGLASHGRFNGAFKPANRSRQVEGLYLAGGAAHPGPGMPMVLMSGWIAADALDEDVKSGAVSVGAAGKVAAAG